MVHQFLSAKIINPRLPRSPLLENVHIIGIFIHTFVCSIPLILHISDLRLECQLEDMHARPYFARIHVRLPKRKFFHNLGKHSIP